MTDPFSFSEEGRTNGLVSGEGKGIAGSIL
jgi:hypothetical protein